MKQLALVLIAIASIAAGLWFGLRQAPQDQNPYANMGGDFTLQSPEGPVNLHDFKGKVVALYFGYTRCPDVCITSLSKMAMALKSMTDEERKQIQPIFISIDPERDTPAIANEYAGYFYPGAIGLSGTLEQVTEVAKRYRVIFEKVKLENSAMDYSMDHSSIIYVIGRDGKIDSLVQHADNAEALAKALRKALAQ